MRPLYSVVSAIEKGQNIWNRTISMAFHLITSIFFDWVKKIVFDGHKHSIFTIIHTRREEEIKKYHICCGSFKLKSNLNLLVCPFYSWADVCPTRTLWISNEFLLIRINYKSNCACAYACSSLRVHLHPFTYKTTEYLSVRFPF